MPTDIPTSPTFTLRWFYPTPGRLLFLLLSGEGILLLLNWFELTPKGWAVLIAIASVCAMLLLLLGWFLLALLFHWRFQFSVRSLLLLTIAVAIPSSWLAVEMKWAREQKKVFETAVFGMYNEVTIKAASAPGTEERFGVEVIPGPEWAQELLGKDFFGDITTLYYGHEAITDADLKLLERTPYLQDLNLSYTRITDIGMAHVNRLMQLRRLNLKYTAVTDVGLENLKEMKNLQELDLLQTRVSDAGREKLQKALPNCRIEH
jgi:hypothetical protein